MRTRRWRRMPAAGATDPPYVAAGPLDDTYVPRAQPRRIHYSIN
jgi:hypothetical protein